MNRNLIRPFLICIVLVCAARAPASAAPIAIDPITLGVMGDSGSDEYAEQSYGAYSMNWVEQLVAFRGVDVGPTGLWGEPRRTGFEYNWARYGATSGDLLASGQHTGLAAQIGPKGIDYAVLWIGSNDQFDASNAYDNIYHGNWSPAQIGNWVGGMIANINTALSAVVPTGAKIVLLNPPDYGVTPAVQSAYPSAAGRQAVADVVANQVRPQVEALAQAHQVVYADLLGATQAIFGQHHALNTTLTVGNVDIGLQQIDNFGSTPTAGFVHDAIHPHTVLQGLIANLIVTGLDIGYGANLAPFSEAEILAHGGFAYGGSDTLSAQIGDYRDYVVNYVPEPSTWLLVGIGGATLSGAAWMRRRRS